MRRRPVDVATGPPLRPHPKSVRLPEGSDLLAWFADYAAANGTSLNDSLVQAWEEFRAARQAAQQLERERPAS
jgi:hypothetical protein